MFNIDYKDSATIDIRDGTVPDLGTVILHNDKTWLVKQVLKRFGGGGTLTVVPVQKTKEQFYLDELHRVSRELLRKPPKPKKQRACNFPVHHKDLRAEVQDF